MHGVLCFLYKAATGLILAGVPFLFDKNSLLVGLYIRKTELYVKQKRPQIFYRDKFSATSWRFQIASYGIYEEKM